MPIDESGPSGDENEVASEGAQPISNDADRLASVSGEVERIDSAELTALSEDSAPELDVEDVPADPVLPPALPPPPLRASEQAPPVPVVVPSPPPLPGMPRAQVPSVSAAPAAPPVEVPTLEATIAQARARADAAKPEDRAALYEAEMEALGPNSRRRQAIYAHELGELAAERGDEGTAVKAWARALQADPTLRPNLWAIRRVFERRAMWPNVLRLIEAELRLATQPSERAELHVERAVLLEDRLDDTAGADAAFAAAIEADPRALRALMATERRLIERGGESTALRETVARLATATDDRARRAALLVDLARLHADAGDDDAAKRALDEALAVELGEPAGERAFAGSAQPAAIEELERLALRRGKPAWRAEALRHRLALLSIDTVSRPPTSENEAARIARAVVLHLRLGALAEAQGDTAGMLGALDAAAQLAVDDPAAEPLAQLELRDALRAAGQPGRAGLLALEFARQAPDRMRAPLLLDAIDLLESITSADAATVEARDAARVEADAAGLGPALAARARRTAELRGDDEALVRMALAEADRALAAQEVGLGGAQLARAAVLLGERLGRGDEAIALHERALSVLPDGSLWDQHADALEWRFLREGRIDAASQLVKSRIERATDPAKTAHLRVRRAGLLADRANDAAGAADELRLALEVTPDDLRLRHIRVGLLRVANLPTDAAAELGRIVQRTDSDERKAELELERGTLLAWHASDAVAGEAALREAVRLAPSDGRATAALEELFERGRGHTVAPAEERTESLAAALRTQIDSESDPQKVLVTLSRIAELHERRRDWANAAQTYGSMLERSSENADQTVALRGLARAQAALGLAEALFVTLEREHELIDERARPLHRARIAWEKERRGRAQDAEGDHDAVLDSEAPTEVKVASLLGRLRASLRTDEAADQAGALVALIPFVDAELTHARAALDVELADALRRAAELDEAAIVSNRARTVAPELRSAQLAQLVTAGAREDVRAVAGAMVDLSSGLEPSPRGELLRRSALLAWAAGDVEDGRARIEAAAVIHADPATQVLLAEVASGVNALEARLAVAEGQGRVPWLLALSEAQASQGELSASSATLEELLTLAPRSLLGLDLDRRVRKAAGDLRGFARRTLALGELLTDVERAARLLVDAGQAFEAAGELAPAAYAYREALERTPIDGLAYTRDRAMLLAAIDGDDEGRALFAKSALAELYGHRLGSTVDAEERLSALLDRAELAAKEGDRAAAERDLRAALELEPEDARALVAMLRLCAEDRSRLVEVRELLGRIDELSLDPGTRRDVVLRVADAEQRGGGDAARAVAALTEAIEIDEDTPTLRTLAALHRELRQWEPAVTVRKRLVAVLPPDQASRVQLEIAEIHAMGLSDPTAARDAAQRALFLDPLSGEAVAMLVRLDAKPSIGLNAVLEPAADAARGLLHDETRRGVAVQHLRVVARLLADSELEPLTEQLAALLETRALEARVTSKLPTRPLSSLLRGVTRAPELDDVLRELLASLGETTTRLYPIEARFGKLSRPSSKQKPELAELDLLGRALSVSELPVELGDGASIAADDARVAVGRELVPMLTRATGRFRATRVLWLFSEGLGALDRIDDSALLGLVAGCLGVAKVPWPEAFAAKKPSASVVDERTRAIDKIIARKERKALLALAPRLAGMADPATFRAAALGSALRVAMLVSGDVTAAVSEVGAERALELAHFAVSSGFVRARHRWQEGG